jgi:murein DD-endopeptidase MepM/ murein hydrolase activator NlpD
MMVWSYPLSYDLFLTDLSESFLNMEERQTGLPIAPHPGSFGFVRKNHTHEGVDLYARDGSTVYAVEPGLVVGVLPFTGEHADSPWWNDTFAVMVEGASGVVVYGEITPTVEEGQTIRAGEPLGSVRQVLKKDKGRPMSMLHLELHTPGTRDVYEWTVGGDKPASLQDPTPYLIEMMEDKARLVR